VNDFPALGWIGIVCIGVIVVVTNIALVGFLRYRPTMKMSATDRRTSRSAQSWQKMGDFINVLRDPFAKDRSQMEQLARAVEKLEDRDGNPHA
jgi:hypothetical protein